MKGVSAEEEVALQKYVSKTLSEREQREKALEARAEAAEAKVEAFKREASVLRKKLAAKEVKLDELEDGISEQLSRVESNRSAVEKDGESLLRKVAELQAELDLKNRVVHSLTKALDESDNKVATLEREVMQSRAGIEKLQVALEHKTKQLEAIAGVDDPRSRVLEDERSRLSGDRPLLEEKSRQSEQSRPVIDERSHPVSERSRMIIAESYPVNERSHPVTERSQPISERSRMLIDQASYEAYDEPLMNERSHPVTEISHAFVDTSSRPMNGVITDGSPVIVDERSEQSRAHNDALTEPISERSRTVKEERSHVSDRSQVVKSERSRLASERSGPVYGDPSQSVKDERSRPVNEEQPPSVKASSPLKAEPSISAKGSSPISAKASSPPKAASVAGPASGPESRQVSFVNPVNGAVAIYSGSEAVCLALRAVRWELQDLVALCAESARALANENLHSENQPKVSEAQLSLQAPKASDAKSALQLIQVQLGSKQEAPAIDRDDSEDEASERETVDGFNSVGGAGEQYHC
ncbi:hypothetical protein DIPPA_05078 [Diplonema papillatum]|nr:hypothetical protein DIPPA_05078 [Diplonema papillatum]